MSVEDNIILEARGISKTFPGVKALDNVSLALRRGCLTALLGENGAGKSTLMNIIAGVFPGDTGEVRFAGEVVQFSNPGEARAAGISMIFQELNLVSNLTVAENIFLGREPLNRFGLIDAATMNERAEVMLDQLDLAVAPTTPLGNLRVGQQQIVEIAKAISTDARVLIMDEPTSAVTENEIEVLFRIIDDLKQQGVAIAYITHKLEELRRIGDDAVVMRDGKVIGAAPLKNLNQDAIVQMMVGREMKELFSRKPTSPGEEALRVENLSLAHPERSDRFLVRDVHFHVCRGEVLGVFGLMGAGRTELLETIFGLHPKTSTGEIFVNGRSARILSPVDAIKHGLALAPEDRKHEGLVLEMSVAENASLACVPRLERFGLIDETAERLLVAKSIDRFRIKTHSQKQVIRNLSGGNQQKVILGKWIATEALMLLLDEPTRGIDVNAKGEIYSLIDELANDGLALVVVSSELPEVLAISDRIVVLCEGRMTGEFARAEASEEAIMKAALPKES